MRLNLVRTLNGWAPADDAAREAARKFTVGETYRADIVKPRDHKSLARWWVLCQLHACDTCHAAIDGRLKSAYTKEQLELFHWEGVGRTIDWLFRRGKL